jgi:hypothetical protein
MMSSSRHFSFLSCLQNSRKAKETVEFLETRPTGEGFLHLIGDSEENASALVYDLIANDTYGGREGAPSPTARFRTLLDRSKRAND